MNKEEFDALISSSVPEGGEKGHYASLLEDTLNEADPSEDDQNKQERLLDIARYAGYLQMLEPGSHAEINTQIFTQCPVSKDYCIYTHFFDFGSALQLSRDFAEKQIPILDPPPKPNDTDFEEKEQRWNDLFWEQHDRVMDVLLTVLDFIAVWIGMEYVNRLKHEDHDSVGSILNWRRLQEKFKSDARDLLISFLKMDKDYFGPFWQKIEDMFSPYTINLERSNIVNEFKKKIDQICHPGENFGEKLFYRKIISPDTMDGLREAVEFQLEETELSSGAIQYISYHAVCENVAKEYMLKMCLAAKPESKSWHIVQTGHEQGAQGCKRPGISVFCKDDPKKKIAQYSVHACLFQKAGKWNIKGWPEMGQNGDNDNVYKGAVLMSIHRYKSDYLLVQLDNFWPPEYLSQCHSENGFYEIPFDRVEEEDFRKQFLIDAANTVASVEIKNPVGEIHNFISFANIFRGLADDDMDEIGLAAAAADLSDDVPEDEMPEPLYNWNGLFQSLSDDVQENLINTIVQEGNLYYTAVILKNDGTIIRVPASELSDDLSHALPDEVEVSDCREIYTFISDNSTQVDSLSEKIQTNRSPVDSDFDEYRGESMLIIRYSFDSEQAAFKIEPLYNMLM